MLINIGEVDAFKFFFSIKFNLLTKVNCLISDIFHYLNTNQVYVTCKQ